MENIALIYDALSARAAQRERVARVGRSNV